MPRDHAGSAGSSGAIFGQWHTSVRTIPGLSGVHPLAYWFHHRLLDMKPAPGAGPVRLQYGT